MYRVRCIIVVSYTYLMRSLKKNYYYYFGTERFHTSSVNAKRFQMAPEVMKMEEKGVLNHKNPVFFGI